MQFIPLFLLIFLPSQVMAAETAGGAASPLANGFRVIGGLVLVIGLVLLAYAATKRRGGLFQGNRGTAVKVLETKHLGPKKALALIEVRGEEMLIGIGNEGINLICRFNGANKDSFASSLQQQMDRSL